MAENRPAIKEHRLATRAAAVALGGLVLAGCAHQEPAPAAPAIVAQAPPTKSPEQIVQDEVRRDAVAAVQLVGSLLKNADGKSVYSGQRVDNFGDSDAAPKDRPAVSVTRNANAHELTVDVSNLDGSGFSMTLYDADTDPLMKAPELTPQLLAQGPVAGNLEVEALSMHDSGKEQPLIGIDKGHLVDAGTGDNLSRGDVMTDGSIMLAEVQDAAYDLRDAGYPDIVKQLPRDAIEELNR